MTKASHGAKEGEICPLTQTTELRELRKFLNQGSLLSVAMKRISCSTLTAGNCWTQEKKKKKTAEQLASEAAAAAEQSAKQAAADSERLRAKQAAELARLSKLRTQLPPSAFSGL